MIIPKILVVGDDAEVIEFLVHILEKEECYNVKAASGNGVAESLGSDSFGIVIAEFTTKKSNGQMVLDYIVEHYPQVKCLVYAKDASISNSVEALKKGAFDYLALSDTDNLIPAVKKALEEDDLSVPAPVKRNVRTNARFGHLIGKSRAILNVFSIVEKVAHTGSTVLITGESGTGKELIARSIHENSKRFDKPLIVINCGAIPGELLESELFGHEKGAFTGAHRTRIGRFELADEGTIFLDEIGDMSPNLQVKLLRVLQEQNFERVGSTKQIKVNIRIIAATNQDLNNLIKEESFREDLFYRLNVIPVKVAPLRQRKSDIPLLVSYFQKKLSDRRGGGLKTFSDATMDALISYNWPGNIRELENLMERLYVLADNDVIKVSDLPENIQGKEPTMFQYSLSPMESGLSFNDAVENYQKMIILKALDQTNWVKAKAAELLKMNRTTLVEKIKKLKIKADMEQQFFSQTP